MLYKKLIDIGLNEKEAKAYLAALELGVATANDIATKAKLTRPTAYVVLESLIKKGSVSSFEKNKKKYFAAEAPEQLLRIMHLQEEEVKRKREDFTHILPELKSIYNIAKDKPTVRFYEGKAGLLSMLDDYSRKANETHYTIFSVDDVMKIFTDEERSHQSARRIKKNIKIKAIVTALNREYRQKRPLSDRRYIPYEKFPLTSDITIYENKVGIASLRGKLSGVIVESQEIAHTMKAIFDLAWEAAKKYN